jgi:anti-sigma B factor antagonist
MSFKTQEHGDGKIAVIEIPERLTIDTADELKQMLKDYVENGVVKIVMNLENTNYMDSSGLGAIVSKIAVTRSNKGDIRLARVKKYVEYLLELTHLDKILKSYPTVEEAVASFKD